VHEQTLPALRGLGYPIRWCDVAVHHAGYQDRALRRRKLERDLRLLRLEDAERPDDPFTLFNLGSVHQELGRRAEAVVFYRRSLERSDPRDSIVRKLYAMLAQCLRQAGRLDEALVACQAGRSHYPEDAELLFQEAVARRERGDLAGAAGCLVRLLGGRAAEHFTSVDTGVGGYKARYHLAAVYRDQGRIAEAEAQWRRALDECPGFLPAWLGLAELYLAQGRWADLEDAAGRLAAVPGVSPAEAVVLRARSHMGRKEYPAARQLLEAAIAQAPRELPPRVVLSHCLLQEARDGAAAERALRNVLGLDPDHAEARRNLAILLEHQGRPAEAALLRQPLLARN
jgi:tetratricopeptide (TPR) repeat protein